MPRIVSLIASATEIVCALGYQQQLVGRSHECDFPESVRRLPACTEPKFPVDGSSADIDRLVRSTLEQSLSVYRVHQDLLRSLRPDIIVTQAQCEVCAVSERDVLQSLAHWIEGRPRVVSLRPDRLQDVWSDVRQVALALGVPERGESLIRELQQRLEAIAGTARRIGARPTVACIDWIDPLMASGNWMPELIELAGGINVFGQAGEHAPSLAWEGLIRADPEVIVVMPCGFDLERTRREMPPLTARAGWSGLRAVRSGRVFLTDGNQFFNRPGPRLVESTEILAEVLHPADFSFGHRGSGWQPLLP